MNLAVLISILFRLCLQLCFWDFLSCKFPKNALSEFKRNNLCQTHSFLKLVYLLIHIKLCAQKHLMIMCLSSYIYTLTHTHSLLCGFSFLLLIFSCQQVGKFSNGPKQSCQNENILWNQLRILSKEPKFYKLCLKSFLLASYCYIYNFQVSALITDVFTESRLSKGKRVQFVS